MKHRTLQSNNSLFNYHVLLNKDVFTVMFYLLAKPRKQEIKQIVKISIPEARY